MIDIDMDVRCSRCSEKGVIENGLCIKCAADPFQAIGDKVIVRAQKEICHLIEDNQQEIDKAYIKAGGDLAVNLGLKMTGTRVAGEVELTVSISFIESRIKQAVKVVVNEKQMKIPGVS